MIYIGNGSYPVETLTEHYALSYFIVNLVGIAAVDCCV